MGNDALKKLKAITGTGTLGGKHGEIDLFLNSGCSLMYSGDVSWQVKLPKETLRGTSESVDAALGHLRSLFADILLTAAPGTRISVALKELHNPKD